MLTPLHFYFSHYFQCFKGEYSKILSYFCCCSCWLLCQKLQAGRGILKSLLLIFQFSAFDHWGLSACLLCAVLAMIGREKCWMHEICDCPFISIDPYEKHKTKAFHCARFHIPWPWKMKFIFFFKSEEMCLCTWTSPLLRYSQPPEHHPF